MQLHTVAQGLVLKMQSPTSQCKSDLTGGVDHRLATQEAIAIGQIPTLSCLQVAESRVLHSSNIDTYS